MNFFTGSICLCFFLLPVFSSIHYNAWDWWGKVQQGTINLMIVHLTTIMMSFRNHREEHTLKPQHWTLTELVLLLVQ